MRNTATIIEFKPKQVQSNRRKASQKRIVNVDGIKYFNREQIRLVRRTVRDRAISSSTKGNLTAIREWAAVDLLISSGLRVSETADLRCGDVKSAYGECAIFVRNGKGGRSRTVQVPDSLKRHLKSFVRWKVEQGEPTGVDDYLFVGQRGPWTSQAIQQVIKKYLKLLGLYESGKSVHALRHSYAVELYRKCNNIRIVQKQLGHASILTTQIYVDITREQIQEQVVGIWAN